MSDIDLGEMVTDAVDAIVDVTSALLPNNNNNAGAVSKASDRRLIEK